KALCVQYGTANIVAVPVEAGPGGTSVPPQFVNTGLLEFARCLALLGRMWRLRFGLNQEQAGRWTGDFQAQLAVLGPAALGSPESWGWVLLEPMWGGLVWGAAPEVGRAGPGRSVPTGPGRRFRRRGSVLAAGGAGEDPALDLLVPAAVFL